MRIIALEEHYGVAELMKKIDPDLIVKRGYPRPDAPSTRPQIEANLVDLGESRIADMDKHGITMQVLSTSGPGSDLLPPADAAAWARDCNDILADEIKKRPDRYAGFAHLPLSDPDAAAKELERCITKLGFKATMVNGTTDGKFFDDPRFEPIIATCEKLDIPLYVHPGIPPAAVREAYYSNLPGPMPTILSRAGYGWHTEAAIHIIRLCLAGVLDKHPKLKVVIGHQGEGLPAALTRFDEQFGPLSPKFLQRTVTEMLHDQLHITTAGFYSVPAFNMLLQTFGIDKLMFSVDYPYSQHAWARDFLDKIELSPADREKFAHGNAEKLLKIKPEG
ncbi:MAG: amidohydrolase family protein [Beijerinckiaceae bacterium]